MSYWNYSNDGQSPFTGIIGNASNIKIGSNPSFVLADFFNMYPQFDDETIIPSSMVQNFIDAANASINQQRWKSYWQLAMGWFIAHFCTVFIQSMNDTSGQPRGLNTSESVGDVSVSTDYSMGAVNGWGTWNTTSFGQQLATIGKIVGKGGMYVW